MPCGSLQEKLKLCTLGVGAVSLEEMSRLFGKDRGVVLDSCSNSAPCVGTGQNDSPGRNKSQPMEQLAVFGSTDHVTPGYWGRHLLWQGRALIQHGGVCPGREGRNC